MSQKVYVGKMLDARLGKREVTVNGQPLYNYEEPEYQDPAEFTWGYVGGGPHTLAISILCDFLDVPQGKEVKMPDFPWSRYVYDFMYEHIKQWPLDGDFRITSEEIAAWIASKPPIVEEIEEEWL